MGEEGTVVVSRNVEVVLGRAVVPGTGFQDVGPVTRRGKELACER